MSKILRGEIWLVNLNPVKSHEQSGNRPCLVISVNLFNQTAAELVIVLPITSKDKKIPFHVSIEPPEGGISIKSFIKCEDVRSVSTERLTRCLGQVSEITLQKVEERLRILMGL
jgi:mRNA interferase MazF